MTDNEEIQYQLTMGHLGNFNLPEGALHNVDLKNSGTQRAILNCSTKEQMVVVLAAHGGEVDQHGN